MVAYQLIFGEVSCIWGQVQLSIWTLCSKLLFGHATFFFCSCTYWRLCNSADFSQMGSSRNDIVVLWFWAMVLEGCNIWRRVMIIISDIQFLVLFSWKQVLICVDTLFTDARLFHWTGSPKNWLKLKQNWFVTFLIVFLF